MKAVWWLALLGALSGCSPKAGPEVRTARVSRGDLVAHLSASGRVEARNIRISTPMDGRLMAIHVKLNDGVHKGQRLASLDDRDIQTRIRTSESDLSRAQSHCYEAEQALLNRRRQLRNEQARAEAARDEANASLRLVAAPADREELRKAQGQVDADQARLSKAMKDLARGQELYGQDIVSVAQIEQFHSAVAIAIAQRTQSESDLRRLRRGATPESLAVARSKVERANVDLSATGEQEAELAVLAQQLAAARADVQRNQAQLDSTRVALERATVKAPVAGVVSQILWQPGEVVGWGTTILTLKKDEEVWIDAQVDEQDAGLVHLDQEVQVRLSSRSGKVYKGQVSEVAPTLEQRPNAPGDSQILRIKVSLRPAVPGLRPGLQADIQGEEVLARQALLVPHSAVGHDSQGNYVLLLQGSRVHRQPVDLGASTPELAEVKSGLTLDQVIVAEATEGIADGTEVRARP